MRLKKISNSLHLLILFIVCVLGILVSGTLQSQTFIIPIEPQARSQQQYKFYFGDQVDIIGGFYKNVSGRALITGMVRGQWGLPDSTYQVRFVCFDGLKDFRSVATAEIYAQYLRTSQTWSDDISGLHPRTRSTHPRAGDTHPHFVAPTITPPPTIAPDDYKPKVPTPRPEYE